MHNIIITGGLHPVAFEILDKEADITYNYAPDTPREKLIEIIDRYDAIICRSETDIDKTLIDAAKNLKVIARAAVGYGNIDVDYASTKGILVFNTPGVNTNSAAELTVGLLLAVCRKIVAAHISTQGGGWNRHQFTGTELSGKTVGIIGLGNVGRQVAHFLHAFKCKLMAYDPFVTGDYCSKNNCEQVSFKKICTDSDIITIHTPKNKSTVNMIDATEFETMRDGVIIINAARGGLINESALVRYLDSGKVAFAGIDTFDVEPTPKDNPLLTHPNVVITPHIGASTVEAQYKIACSAISETVQGLRGGIVRNPLNLPRMLSIDNEQIRLYASLSERLGVISARYLAQEFHPLKFEFNFRGQLEKKDAGIVKLAFMKSFMSCYSNLPVTYVNALSCAEEKGFIITETDDQSFSDYEKAIRIIIQSSNNRFSIGGTVLGKNKMLMTYFQGLAYDVEPFGNMVLVENKDVPGVIGHVGLVMAKHNININRLHLARHEKGGDALSIIRIDSDLTDQAEKDLLREEFIKKVSFISLSQ